MATPPNPIHVFIIERGHTNGDQIYMNCPEHRIADVEAILDTVPGATYQTISLLAIVPLDLSTPENVTESVQVVIQSIHQDPNHTEDNVFETSGANQRVLTNTIASSAVGYKITTTYSYRFAINHKQFNERTSFTQVLDSV